VKKVAVINIDADKCMGCRACEAACSAYHASPKYSSTNPERSRIRVSYDQLNDIYLPVMGGEYTSAECNARYAVTVDGKKYDECGFCRASCPSRDLFKDPDSGLPLRCDLCDNLEDGDLDEPWCVKWCLNDALTYEEREEEVEDEEEVQLEEMEIGLESLVDKYGLQKVQDTIARLSQKGEEIKA
jgi:benzoyl-CoA reductase subunit BamC